MKKFLKNFWALYKRGGLLIFMPSTIVDLIAAMVTKNTTKAISGISGVFVISLLFPVLWTLFLSDETFPKMKPLARKILFTSAFVPCWGASQLIFDWFYNVEISFSKMIALGVFTVIVFVFISLMVFRNTNTFFSQNDYNNRLAEWKRNHGDGAKRAQFPLGEEYDDMEQLELRAEQGEADYIQQLGMILYSGANKRSKNIPRAVKLFKRAAELGHVGAYLMLGKCYLSGIGVEQDEAEGARFYIKAAEAGIADIWAQLGGLYYAGAGVPLDYSEAFKWFTKAAERGNINGCIFLGDCYRLGRGAEVNYDEALFWYKRAEETGALFGGSPWAKVGIGTMYKEGAGVPQSYREAVKWYKKAAKQGYPGGYYALGQMYENGLGVRRNPRRAEKLYRKALHPMPIYVTARPDEDFEREVRAALARVTAV